MAAAVVSTTIKINNLSSHDHPVNGQSKRVIEEVMGETREGVDKIICARGNSNISSDN